DNHLHGPGSKVYLPVRQPGGMFAVGDMHASMGDGEVCGTGVEIAGELVVRFDLVKGKQGRWPVTELRDSWVVHGTSGGDLREAGSSSLARPAASRSVSALSVRSHVKSWSSRPKCPYAAVLA